MAPVGGLFCAQHLSLVLHVQDIKQDKVVTCPFLGRSISIWSIIVNRVWTLNNFLCGNICSCKVVQYDCRHPDWTADNSIFSAHNWTYIYIFRRNFNFVLDGVSSLNCYICCFYELNCSIYKEIWKLLQKCFYKSYELLD